MRKEKIIRALLWTGVAVLFITMIVSTSMRTSRLAESMQTGRLPPPNKIDAGYARYPILTLIHILPGIIFLLLGALQFMKLIRHRHITWHRWSGRTYIVLGWIIGVTAIIMSIRIRFGGYVETAAILLFGTFFLYSLSRAYLHIRRKEWLPHREWMIRAYAIGLAIATMRPVIGLFFAFTSLPFAQFFGYVFWIAFLLHLSVAEAWIRFTRKRIDYP